MQFVSSGEPVRSLGSLSYADLVDISIARFRSLAASDELEWYKTSKSVLSRFPIRQFRAALAGASPFEQAFCELFLVARMRAFMLAYLSVQEADDFESGGQQFPGFVHTSLYQLGKQLRARFAFRLLGIRLLIDADPFCHLRSIYLNCLREQHAAEGRSSKKPLGRLSIRIHRILFRSKMAVFHRVSRWYSARLSHIFQRNGNDWFFEKNLNHYLCYLLPRLSPHTGHFTRADWLWVIDQASRFLSERVRALLEVIPAHSLRDNGLSKLLKVAVGVLAGRASRMTPDAPPTREFVLDSLRLAYCWGITYPLVDNILDSSACSLEEKARLHEVLKLSFASDGIDLSAARAAAEHASAAARELVSCFEIAFSITDRSRWKNTQQILQLLLESHRRDAARRLESLEPGESHWEAVWADTLLKAALVRWATMDLCGIDVSPEAVASGIRSAPFNQLGDDMWDVDEDEREDRVTPFTVHRKDPTTPDPALLYFRVASDVCSISTRRQREATFLGVCEVVADCYSSGTLPESVRSLLERHDRDFPLTLQSACRVDPDAVLFAFERIAQEITD